MHRFFIPLFVLLVGFAAAPGAAAYTYRPSQFADACPDAQTTAFFRQQLAIGQGLPAPERTRFDARLMRWMAQQKARCTQANAPPSCGHGLRC